MSTGLTADLQRVIVDPNRASRVHPQLSPVLLDDFNRIPTVGERVVAMQPDDESGPNYLGSATVRIVDRQSGLAFLDVDWPSFRVEIAPVTTLQSSGSAPGSRGRAFLRHLGGAANMPGHSGNSTRRGRVRTA